jgi:thymidylate kinase
MHPRLESLFAALQGRTVEWSLLRLPRDPEMPPGDVDLLVGTEDLRTFDAVAREHEFVPVPGWDQPPSLLYIAFDEEAGRFLVLDVTDRVAFGRHGDLPTALAPGVLSRRVARGATMMPCPDDAFWLLLLHCLLDKGTVPSHYRARLRKAACSAGLDGDLPRTLDRLAEAAGVSAASLRAAAAEGNWDVLARSALPLSTVWRQAVPVRQRTALVRDRLARAVARPALLSRRRGLSVALLGPNGAGKSTLAEGIATTFPLPVAQVYMGLWKSGDGTRPPSWPRQVADAAARPIRAWARFLTATAHQAAGELVVFDRYIYDARRPPAPPAVTAKRVYFWLLSRSCGRPDLSLLLDLPGATAHARKAENSVAETEAERREYLALLGELPLHVLDASQSADVVRRQALTLIWDAYRRRWAGTRPTVPAAAPDGGLSP